MFLRNMPITEIQGRCLSVPRFLTVFTGYKEEMKMAINSVAQTDATNIASLADLARTKDAQPVAKESTPAQTQPTTTDTVQLSRAAKALQEASETAAQTAQEANKGDVQAQRKLSREEANEPPTARAQESQGTPVTNLFK
jgi:hypothetical protein